LKVKIDENLGLSHLKLLKQMGYEAERVHEEGLSGVPDRLLFSHVVENGQFLVTLDLDFSSIVNFPPGKHPGILVLRPKSRSKRAAFNLLQKILSQHALREFDGCLVIADEQRIRVRRP